MWLSRIGRLGTTQRHLDRGHNGVLSAHGAVDLQLPRARGAIIQADPRRIHQNPIKSMKIHEKQARVGPESGRLRAPLPSLLLSKELLRLMSEALGPFPDSLLASAQDSRLRRCAERLPRAAPQLSRRLRLSTPSEVACGDLLQRLLCLEPAERITASEALRLGALLGLRARRRRCSQLSRHDMNCNDLNILNIIRYGPWDLEVPQLHDGRGLAAFRWALHVARWSRQRGARSCVA